ncbi:hypothetical protein K474DRAFT_1767809 [Panus rudis PR-1116 ss-1]|nr:hypothetical protein K474DRAFT_1767809 [Panus rudis PR-1116 ss-1]
MSLKLKAWITYATPKARNIVRSVLANSGCVALTTQEIFDRAIKQYPHETSPSPPVYEVESRQKGKQPKAMPEPPFGEHPIRSVRYLKRLVLEDLVARGEVVKAHVRRGGAGDDGKGQKWDLIAAKGFAKAKAVTGIERKEAWMWLLTSQLKTAQRGEEGTLADAHVIEPPNPQQVKLEADNDDYTLDDFKEDGGWEHLKLSFKDVSPMKLREMANQIERS